MTASGESARIKIGDARLTDIGFASTVPAEVLSISSILEHGRRVFGASSALTYHGDGQTSTRSTYAEMADTSLRLISALAELGIQKGDRVATFLWNVEEHVAAYFAVPSMGAVLHTVNLRLSSEQLQFVLNEGGARVLLTSGDLVPQLREVWDGLEHIRHVVIIDERPEDTDFPGAQVHRFSELVAPHVPARPCADIAENDAAVLCFTSGTTGRPKGVVYSHRSIYLHSMSIGTGNVFGLSEHDNVLPIVPMFHANAWGLIYGGWMAGTNFVLPGRHLTADHLAAMIQTYRPTIASAVPTIWTNLLEYMRSTPTDISSVRLVPCGGAVVPRPLMEAYETEFGVRIVQAWGMTETSPVASFAHEAARSPAAEKYDWRSKSGRVVMGVRIRIVDESGQELAWDGTSRGELQVRGLWVTERYLNDADADGFVDGWLRTGDVATITAGGYLMIVDRLKDMIKSGGEWISSADLEVAIMSHPAVREAAVVAVPDERWGERPLAFVAVRGGATVTSRELREHLADRFAKWQLPERWSFIEEIPKTGVGKFDKQRLRELCGQ